MSITDYDFAKSVTNGDMIEYINGYITINGIYIKPCGVLEYHKFVDDMRNKFKREERIKKINTILCKL